MFNMHQVDVAALDHLDVKTLRMLSALLDTASVTRSGETLGLSQPAASRAVERLRRALGDTLLARTSKGYVLTARAEALKPLVVEALAALARVCEQGVFDPATTRRTFRIASTDYGSVTVLSHWAARVAQAAPGICLDVLPFGPGTLSNLENGRLDCALYADAELPPDFHYRELFRDDYACLARRGHPGLEASSGKTILTAIAACRQAVVMYPDGGQMRPDDVLQMLGVSPAPASLRTPYFMSAPWVIAETDLVMCAPRRVAERLATLTNLQVIPLPGSPSFGYRLIWHERSHLDPGLKWLRDISRMIRTDQQVRSSI